jgi:hypothetical protein
MAAPRSNMITIKSITPRPSALEERLLKNLDMFLKNGEVTEKKRNCDLVRSLITILIKYHINTVVSWL